MHGKNQVRVNIIRKLILFMRVSIYQILYLKQTVKVAIFLYNLKVVLMVCASFVPCKADCWVVNISLVNLIMKNIKYFKCISIILIQMY